MHEHALRKSARTGVQGKALSEKECLRIARKKRDRFLRFAPHYVQIVKEVWKRRLKKPATVSVRRISLPMT